MNVYFTKEFTDNYKKLKDYMKERIDKAIDEIISNPECGKVLRYALKGLRSYRIGNMRIIYKIEDDNLYFITFGHRKKIYDDLRRRK